MSKTTRTCLAGVATVGMALGSAGVRAQDPPAVTTLAAPEAVHALAQPVARTSDVDALWGAEPVAPEVLASKRGGTQIHNDMLSQGYVSENQAINVTTGANFISEGSFANAGGVPMVVQNTGNNVLIQNSTILNIQVK